MRLSNEVTSSLITDYGHALAFLDARIGHGVKPGLERIAGLLDLMTNPHLSYPVVHVAGTNGKTTTVRMISALLESRGLHVGSFTSPHLRAVEERFTVSGADLTRDGFVEAVADVAPFVDLYEKDTGESVTYFELTAAIAFQAFAAAGVEIAAVEVGLGGRLDATNVVSAEVSVVTGIAMDHMSFLGSTLGEIAREKAQILKDSGTLVTGPLPPAAEGAFTARVAETGSEWIRFESDFGVDDAERAVGGWQASIRGVFGDYEDIYVPLHGRHQVDHLATAIAACELIFGGKLDEETVRSGASSFDSPGRIQVVGTSPLVVVDGAHNEQGIDGLAEALSNEFRPNNWTLVAGARGERDIDDLLRPLQGLVARVIATQPDDAAAIPAGEVAAAAGRLFGEDVPVEVSVPVAQAVMDALATVDETGAIVVTGSLYVVGEALVHLGE